jgi:hypothetical protein
MFCAVHLIVFLLTLAAVESLAPRTFRCEIRSSPRSLQRLTRLHSSSDNAGPNVNKKLSQIATLNLMAAKLRSEAAELEVSDPKTRYFKPFLNLIP